MKIISAFVLRFVLLVTKVGRVRILKALDFKKWGRLEPSSLTEVYAYGIRQQRLRRTPRETYNLLRAIKIDFLRAVIVHCSLVKPKLQIASLSAALCAHTQRCVDLYLHFVYYRPS